MKKKGFTLVELLAVIAILAILVIIALPNVLSMFNSAKKSTFVTEVQSIYKQAQTDFINDSIKSSGAKYYCSAAAGSKNGSSKDNCKNLNLTTTKEYAIYMTSDGAVVYLGVKDSSFTYGIVNPASINAVVEADVLDASNDTGFALWTKKTNGRTSGATTSVNASY